MSQSFAMLLYILNDHNIYSKIHAPPGGLIKYQIATYLCCNPQEAFDMVEESSSEGQSPLQSPNIVLIAVMASAVLAFSRTGLQPYWPSAVLAFCRTGLQPSWPSAVLAFSRTGL